MNELAKLSIIMSGTETTFYRLMTDNSFIFIILSAMSLMLFYNEYSQINPKKLYTILIIGILIISWVLITVNFSLGPSEGFKLIYITYLLSAAYSGIIFLYLSIMFLKESLKASQTQGLLFGIANLCLFTYQILKMLYGMIGLFLLDALTLVFILSAFILYFLAIYLPKYSSN